MKAVVVGAGIGGLAAALALARKGWEIEVLERNPILREMGAGLQISPNGVRVLRKLGVTDHLGDDIFEPEAISMVMGRSGRQVMRLPMKGYAEERWDAPFYQVHRADLQRALADALGKQVGPVLTTGVTATGYVRERGGASVYLDGKDRVFGDLVIAADGIRSQLRAQLAGQDRARFTGNSAWRCVVETEVLGDHAPPPEGRIWAGRGRHAITTRLRGGRLVNFVGIVEQDSWTEEGWRIEGARGEALADFADWHPTIAAILNAAPKLHRWALFDRPPLAQWTDGPVTLLGDAAHPMLPSMAQGAVQALEDATVLADALEDRKDVAEGLALYAALRQPRTRQIQARSAENLTLFHKPNWLSQLAAYAPIWMADKVNPNWIHKRQDWIYSYDAGVAVERSK